MIKKFFNWLFGTTPTEPDLVLLRDALSKELEFPVQKEEWTKRKPSFKKAIKKPVAKNSPQVKVRTPAKKVAPKPATKKPVKKAVKGK